MKLWHVVQYGNKEYFDQGKGNNGPDTNCIVAAPTLAVAVNRAGFYFSAGPYSFNGDQADVVYLLGDDGRPDGVPEIVIHRWVQTAANPRHYPAWYRKHDTGEWLDEATMYGDLKK